jgi:ankyrin repeat protein
VVSALLALPGIDSGVINNSGASPFEVALRGGSDSLGCVALLVPLLDDPNRSIGRGSLTALGVACEASNLGAVKLLASLPGIDVNLSSSSFASASGSASGEDAGKEAEEGTAKKLPSKSISGGTPLHLACEAEA